MIGPSPFGPAGARGMFAQRPLRQGHRVARLRGEWVPAKMFQQRAKLDKTHEYDGLRVHGRYMVDPALWNSTGQEPGEWFLLNHSLRHNVTTRRGRPADFPDETRDEVIFETSKPVDAGTELRYPYTSHTPKEWSD